VLGLHPVFGRRGEGGFWKCWDCTQCSGEGGGRLLEVLGLHPVFGRRGGRLLEVLGLHPVFGRRGEGGFWKG